MSRFNTAESENGSGLNKAVTELETVLSEQGGVSPEVTGQLISLENASEDDFADIETTFKDVSVSVENAMSNAGIENLTAAQKEAGAIVAMAAGNPEGYHEAATRTVDAVSVEGIDVVPANGFGEHGNIEFYDNVALESFEEKELIKTINASTVFNIAAAKQDDFGEKWYPTVVLTPDQVGLKQKITSILVHKELQHLKGGKPTKFQKTNLIRAQVDASILENNATAVIPYVAEDNTNSDMFIASSLVAPRKVDVNGTTFDTAPLLFNKNLDLLGISAVPGLINGGVLDFTDRLDGHVAMKRIYVSITDGTDKVIVAVNVHKQPRSAFLKTREGGSNEMELNYRNESIVLKGDTLTVAATKLSDTFGSLARYTLVFSSMINGELDLETGGLAIYGQGPVLARAVDVAGESLAITDTTLVTDLKPLTFKLEGYEVEAFRTNSNLRNRGLMLDTQTVEEIYTIPLLAPITVPAPLSSAGRRHLDLKTMASAVRTKINNNAVTAALNYAARLRDFNTAVVANEPAPELEGIARHQVTPYYREFDLDLTKIVDARRSFEKAEDVKAAILEVIRNEAYRMNVDSNYGAALDHETSGNEKAQLMIGTDTILERYMWESGDPRTFGKGFEENFVIASTPDARMENTILMTFTRTGQPTSPLTNGCHAMIPELVTNAQVQRGGVTVKETQVQPRSRHINNLPIMVRINVQNLDKVMKESING